MTISDRSLLVTSIICLAIAGAIAATSYIPRERTYLVTICIQNAYGTDYRETTVKTDCLNTEAINQLKEWVRGQTPAAGPIAITVINVTKLEQ